MEEKKEKRLRETQYDKITPEQSILETLYRFSIAKSIDRDTGRSYSHYDPSEFTVRMLADNSVKFNSRQISVGLENLLDEELIEEVGRGYALTPEGKIEGRRLYNNFEAQSERDGVRISKELRDYRWGR